MITPDPLYEDISFNFGGKTLTGKMVIDLTNGDRTIKFPCYLWGPVA